MRTFIALDVPTQFADELADTARVLAQSVEGRFLPRSTYHLTLAFLGEISDAKSRTVVEIMEDVFAEQNAFRLWCDGIGKFGKSHDATVYASLQASESLVHLVEELRQELNQAGFHVDEKKFRAHITLARRAKLPKGPLQLLPFPEPAVFNQVTLYKSVLSQEGATYKPLYSVRLAD